MLHVYAPADGASDREVPRARRVDGSPDVADADDRERLGSSQGKEAVQGAFGRLRQRVIPAQGEQGTKRWVWRQDRGAPADDYWKSALLGARQYDLARDLQTRYVDQGRGIPFSDLVEGGFYGIDVKDQESGRYHVHLHAICDMAYMPQAALSSVWADVTGAPGGGSPADRSARRAVG